MCECANEIIVYEGKKCACEAMYVYGRRRNVCRCACDSAFCRSQVPMKKGGRAYFAGDVRCPPFDRMWNLLDGCAAPHTTDHPFIIY